MSYHAHSKDWSDSADVQDDPSWHTYKLESFVFRLRKIHTRIVVSKMHSNEAILFFLINRCRFNITVK